MRDVTEARPARVLSTGRNAVRIAFDDESTVRIGEIKRAQGKRSMVVPGDLVMARAMADDRAIIDTVQPRTSELTRRMGEREKVMAANIDTIVAVTSLANPQPRLLVLDQLLAYAELEDIHALCIFTKADLADAETVEDVPAIYKRVGYDVLILNPKAGDGLEDFKGALEGRHAILAGVSGVGKSSIFHAIGGEATVGSVSRHGIGRQTTTSAHLYRTAAGFLIDSPGVAEFGLGDITPQQLIEGFREMREFAGQCRFTDCSHLSEPDCAIKQHVEDETIDARRYESYVGLCS